MENIRFDLHIHTKYSPDSFTPIDKILKISKKVGLNGIAITDHDTIKGGIEAKRINKYDLEIIVGSEVTLRNGGEILCLFLNENIKKGNFFEVYDQIKDQDALMILPHPFRRLKKNIEKFSQKELKYIKIIEGINSFNYPSENELAIKYAKKNSLLIVAGSDSHHYSTIGSAFTIFENLNNLKKQLIDGNIRYDGVSINKRMRSKIFINRNLKLKNYKTIIDYNIYNIKGRLK